MNNLHNFSNFKIFNFLSFQGGLWVILIHFFNEKGNSKIENQLPAPFFYFRKIFH